MRHKTDYFYNIYKIKILYARLSQRSSFLASVPRRIAQFSQKGDFSRQRLEVPAIKAVLMMKMEDPLSTEMAKPPVLLHWLLYLPYTRHTLHAPSASSNHSQTTLNAIWERQSRSRRRTVNRIRNGIIINPSHKGAIESLD